jgi:hypothetical protein
LLFFIVSERKNQWGDVRRRYENYLLRIQLIGYVTTGINISKTGGPIGVLPSGVSGIPIDINQDIGPSRLAEGPN